MKLLDTQVISYKYKNTRELNIENDAIPSIVAIEFLLIHPPGSNSASYFIPTMKKLLLGAVSQVSIDHPFRKHSTDRIIFDFGQLHPSFSLFCNFSISELINQKNRPLFDAAVKFLAKPLQKELRRRLNFLIDQNITCDPVTPLDIELGYELLEEFLKKYSQKGNFRNTWNDILILSKSINSTTPLITEDKLLNRFAREKFNGIATSFEGLIEVDFSSGKFPKKVESRESKWYVNNGWNYKIRK